MKALKKELCLMIMEMALSLAHKGMDQQNLHAQDNAMKQFIEKHADKITGTISCFDREKWGQSVISHGSMGSERH